MRKILISAAMIAFVGAVVAGATGAFFSDTETSTGNTFAAGAIDLTVDSTQHYNGMVCTANAVGAQLPYTWQPGDGAQQPYYPPQGSECNGTWAATDLDNGVYTFFNFNDVKPGDEGENTISLHINSNPAWACVDVDITKNDDMTCTEPELDVEDTNCVPDNGNNMDGELAQNIKFAAWLDDGDNVWEVGEPLLFSNKTGPASDVLGGKTYTLADSTTGTPLAGGTTSYIALAWCAGNQVINTDLNRIICDGSGMGNEAQTDSMEASVAFRVEQSRNNGSFRCLPPETHQLVLDNENQTTSGPWETTPSDNIGGLLTWKGNGPTFDYTVTAHGLPAITDYSLIYYADPYPGNHPGKLIGTGSTNSSGNLSFSGNPDLGIDLPMPADANAAIGAKIWLIPSANYNSSTNSVTPWAPDYTWLFEGNVYINYDDTNAS